MYIYHLKPVPFKGSKLIPLNRMDIESELYKNHARKYEGRKHLMDENVPILDCRWNDVVQFSALNPQIIINELKSIQPDFKLHRFECFKVHISDIIEKYDAVVFDRKERRQSNSFTIDHGEIVTLNLESYTELTSVPQMTTDYWSDVKIHGGKYLWFPYIPHVLVKGEIETKDFEIISLSL